MKPTILFIHGMFLTAKSWEKWVSYFEQRGYRCVAPSWPLHDAEPAALRADVPAGLGELGLETLVETFTRYAGAETEKPVVIGHSLGGLIAQLLVARGVAAAAVPICSVAPNAMLSADWGFLKNSAKIANPLAGQHPVEMTAEGFHESFAHVMSEQDSDLAFLRYVVPESRKVLRDALGKAGHIELDRPHAPLLFVAAEKDRIIPDKLNRKNAEAYSDPGSVVNFKEFAGRSHLICDQPRWEEVAHFIAGWLEQQLVPAGAEAYADADVQS